MRKNSKGEVEKKERIKPPPIVPKSKVTPQQQSTSSISTSKNVIEKEETPPIMSEDELDEEEMRLNDQFDFEAECELIKNSGYDESSLAPFDKIQIYNMVSELEEKRGKELDIDEALQQMLDLTHELKNLAISAYEAKCYPESQEEVSEMVKSKSFENYEGEGILIVTRIRALNRDMKLKLKSLREESVKERLLIDSLHLNLQNLLYEAIHIEKEVEEVKDYKSAVESKVDLVPLEEFYTKAPDSICKKELTQNDAHLLRISRLEYEYYERESIGKEILELEKSKKSLRGDLKQSREKLSSIKPLLSSILLSTRPLEEYLGSETSWNKEENEKATQLPPPLYFIYLTSVGYSEYLGSPSLFSILLGGDFERSRNMEEREEKRNYESDSDMEVEEVSERRLTRKASTLVQSVEEKSKKVLEVHPLFIEWKIGQSGSTNSLVVRFYWLTTLRIVTVKSIIDIGTVPTELKELFENSTSDLLCTLFENDIGEESPSPSTIFNLENVQISSYSQLIPKLGRPFKWANRLAALSFPSQKEDEGENVSLSVVQNKLQNVLESQIQLWAHLKQLYSSGVLSKFNKWESTNWEVYSSQVSTSSHISSGLVNQFSIFFQFEILWTQKLIIGQMAVSFMYPQESPIFSFRVQGINDGRLRDLEREVNVDILEENSNMDENEEANYFILQIEKLFSCLKMLLKEDEAEGEVKKYEKLEKGKNFRRPLIYSTNYGGIYEQRY